MTKQISLQTGIIGGANIAVLSWLGYSNKQCFKTTRELIMSHKTCQSNIWGANPNEPQNRWLHTLIYRDLPQYYIKHHTLDKARSERAVLLSVLLCYCISIISRIKKNLGRKIRLTYWSTWVITGPSLSWSTDLRFKSFLNKTHCSSGSQSKPCWASLKSSTISFLHKRQCVCVWGIVSHPPEPPAVYHN